MGPTGLAPGVALLAAEGDGVGLTPISVGSVQRSVTLPALLDELILTGGSILDWESTKPNEAGALDVSDRLEAGPVDDGAAGLGD